MTSAAARRTNVGERAYTLLFLSSRSIVIVSSPAILFLPANRAAFEQTSHGRGMPSAAAAEALVELEAQPRWSVVDALAIAPSVHTPVKTSRSGAVPAASLALGSLTGAIFTRRRPEDSVRRLDQQSEKGHCGCAFMQCSDGA